MLIAKRKITNIVCDKQLASLDLQVMSKLVRNRNIYLSDFFLVRDNANRILIATEDRNMTAIIMLNMSSGFNDYESDVPRLIYELKMSGYEILYVVHITKGREGKTMSCLDSQ